MALDNLDNTEDITPVDNTVQNNLLNNIQSQGSNDLTNINDLLTYTPQENMDSVTGPLAASQYYPGFQHQGAVGQSSGSIIGSHPVFGGGGALVPYGIIDARQGALKRAADVRAADISKFASKDYKLDMSKLPQVNAQLQENFHNYISSSMSDAQKRYGKNWAKQLQADPKFNNGLAQFEAGVKYFDYSAESIARIQADEKAGRFVSQDTKDAMNKILSSYEQLGNGIQPGQDFEELHKNVMKAQSYMNVDKSVNDMASKLNYATNEYLSKVEKNAKGGYDTQHIREVKKITEQQADALVNSTWETQYKGSSVTKEDLKKKLMSLFPEQQSLKVQNVSSDEGKSGLQWGAGGNSAQFGKYSYTYNKDEGVFHDEPWVKDLYDKYVEEHSGVAAGGGVAVVKTFNDWVSSAFPKNKEYIGLAQTDATENKPILLFTGVGSDAKQVNARPTSVYKGTDGKWYVSASTISKTNTSSSTAEDESGNKTTQGQSTETIVPIKDIPLNKENKAVLFSEYPGLDLFISKKDPDFKLGDSEIKGTKVSSTKGNQTTTPAKKTTTKKKVYKGLDANNKPIFE